MFSVFGALVIRDCSLGIDEGLAFAVVGDAQRIGKLADE